MSTPESSITIFVSRIKRVPEEPVIELKRYPDYQKSRGTSDQLFFVECAGKQQLPKHNDLNYMMYCDMNNITLVT